MSKLEKRALLPELRFKDDKGKEYPGWEEKQLFNIATKISNSYSPTSGEESLRCIELESLSSGTGQLLKTFSSIEKKSTKTKFMEGDVLFGKLRPYLQKYYQATFDGVCTSEIWVLRPKSVLSELLYYIVQSPLFSRMASVQFGSRMPRSDWKIVSQSIFTIPSNYKEQQKIVDCLTSIDDLITAQTQKVDTLKAHKKGLMQQLFPAEGETTPKLRFAEFSKGGGGGGREFL